MWANFTSWFVTWLITLQECVLRTGKQLLQITWLFICKYYGIGQLIVKTIVCTDVQPIFIYIFHKSSDGWICVMKVMRFSLVFLLELRVKDLDRTMRDAWLICLEINL